MLVINNYDDDNNNNNNNIIIIGITKKKETNKENSEDFHTYSHAETSREISNFNVYFLDIHRNLFELSLL